MYKIILKNIVDVSCIDVYAISDGIDINSYKIISSFAIVAIIV